MKSKILIILVIGLFAMSCQNGFKTESGLKVSYIEKGTGSPPIQDSIMLIYMTQYADTLLLAKSSPEKPLPVRFEPGKVGGQLMEVVEHLVVGDSVSFTLIAKDLYLNTYQRGIPRELNADSEIEVNLRFARQLDENTWVESQRESKETAYKLSLERDLEILDAYLELNDPNVIKKESGLRYKIVEAGQGNEIEDFDQVTVHYKGRILDGEEFDNSFRRNKPFKLRVSNYEVIKGWDEGLGYLKEGDKAILYVPSVLGYGARSPHPKIPANSILVFEIEVLDVEKK